VVVVVVEEKWKGVDHRNEEAEGRDRTRWREKEKRVESEGREQRERERDRERERGWDKKRTDQSDRIGSRHQPRQEGKMSGIGKEGEKSEQRQENG